MIITEAMDQLVRQLQIKNVAPGTLNNYVYTFKKLNKHFGNIRGVDLTMEKIESFQLEVKMRPYSERYKKQISITLKKVVEVLEKNRASAVDYREIITPKARRTIGDSLTRNQLDALFASVAKRRGVNKVRNIALVKTLYSTGGRISEILQLDRNSIDYDNQSCVIIGKGGKKRTIYFSNKCFGAILKYLKTRKDKSPALFVTDCNLVKATRLTSNWVQKFLRSHGEELGFKINPHKLRHTFATLMIRAGANLIAVQYMLGHESLNTTQMYVHVDNPWVQEMHKKYHH